MKREKILALFFNCEEAALVAPTCIEGHALTSGILLLSVAVFAVTATSPLASKKDTIKPQNKKNTHRKMRRLLARSAQLIIAKQLTGVLHRMSVPAVCSVCTWHSACKSVSYACMHEGTPTYLQKSLGGWQHLAPLWFLRHWT